MKPRRAIQMPRSSRSKKISSLTRGSMPARSAAQRNGRSLACRVSSDPRPLACSATPRSANSALSRSRRRSPRWFTAVSAGSVSTSVSPASPAAIVSTLLLNVPAWPSASARRGSKRAMSSARPPNTPIDIPPPKYLPSVVRSGTRPSSAWRPPIDRREVITSSSTSSAPHSSASTRRPCRNSGVPGMQPPEPSIGSTRMAASSGP